MRVVEGFGLTREVEDLVIADAALTIAFALMLSRGALGGGFAVFLNILPIALVAVTFSFVFHELMHKYVAQHFGAIAAFRRSDMGIVVTLATSFLVGWLIGLPGATVYYAPHFTRKEEAYVSIAGPLTNFAVFAAFFATGSALFPGFSQNIFSSNSYFQTLFAITAYFSLYIAFFNMLPLYPFDGSKIFRWNRPVYFAIVIVLLGLLFWIAGAALGSALVTMFVLALLLSTFFRMTAF